MSPKGSGQPHTSLKLRVATADNSLIHQPPEDEHGHDDPRVRFEHPGRRFTLPSGQVVEVLRVERSRDRCVLRPPHICPCCRSDLVQPLEWGDAGADRWQLHLHCPNCGWSGHGIFRGDELAELEDHLDSGFDELISDLKRLTAANMTDEIERFASALEAGLILPEDF